MYTRKVTGTISKYNNTDLKDGGYAVFTVDSDTGAVENARPVSGRLTASSIRCYATTAYLAVRFDSATGAVMAETDKLSGTDSIHSETFTLDALAMASMTTEPQAVYLCVEGTSGTGVKINFREACTISLEIDYLLPQELLPWTDSPIIKGTTRIKAVHMTELQTNINRQREALALAAWPFATIRAGYTSLGDWTAHVEEMRAAIDDAGTAHDGWTTIDINSPSAAIMEELRAAVEAML